MSGGQFQSLFQPIQIGPLRLRNRVVMPPMSTNFGDPDCPGFVSERHRSYYVERTKGGAALIILEATASGRSAAFRKLGLGLYDDQFIPGLHDLVQRIKACGAACAIQIAATGGGRIGAMRLDGDGNPDPSSLRPDRYFAASPLPHPMTGMVPQELNHRQLEEIMGDLAKAAKRAVQAGFDAIEIHGAHGYLLAEFLSPYTNRRADQYGGDLEGRSRFPLQVIKRIKEEIDDRAVLSYRMSAVEFIQGGLDISDAIRFAKKLEKAGIHVLHISGGTNETPSSMNRVIPPMSFPRGRLVPYAEQIRNEIKIPVIVAQRINTPELADQKYKARLAKDVLKTPEGLGQDILVLGGGSVGIEVAEYLNRYLGKNVTVIEMLDKICGDLGPLNRVNVLERIDRSSINIMLKTKVLELNDEGIIISRDGKEEALKPPDTVVVATGAKPNPRSPEGFEGRIHYIGDCKKVGNAMDAIHDAFHAAVAL